MTDSTVQIIIKTVDQSTKETNKISGGFKDLMKTVGVVTAGLTAFGFAAKKAFDLGKAGAELEYTSKKFDRLAQTIGTTGNALRNDLGEATSGLMSQTEQMQLAGDLMALGLAKTHDEAVRLSKVSSQLGMNMNQLVLTLTNQTTMRFDALGVAVDGFDDKVKALEATGMSASEAFQEAFLQQAEAQLAKVGSVADTTVGSFMKLEAAIKDASDNMKTALSEAMVPLVDTLAEQVTNASGVADNLEKLRRLVDSNVISQKEYNALLQQAHMGYTMNNDVLSEVVVKYQNLEDVLYNTSDAEYELHEARKLGLISTAEMIDANTELATSYDDVNLGLDGQIEKYREMIKFVEAGGLAIQAQVDQVWKDLNNEKITSAEADKELARLSGELAAAMGEFDDLSFDETVGSLMDMGVRAYEALAFAAELKGVLLDIDGMKVDASININTSGDWPAGMPIPQATGGPLAPLALVGEQGPELVINGVVVPAHMSKQLMALGLKPRNKFAGGGPLMEAGAEGFLTPEQVYTTYYLPGQTTGGGGGGGNQSSADKENKEMKAVQAAAVQYGMQIQFDTVTQKTASEIRKSNQNVVDRLEELIDTVLTEDGAGRAFRQAIRTNG